MGCPFFPKQADPGTKSFGLLISQQLHEFVAAAERRVREADPEEDSGAKRLESWGWELQGREAS